MKGFWEGMLGRVWGNFGERLQNFAPNILAMLLIIITGFLISWLAKRISLYFLKKMGLDQLSERWGISAILRGAAVKSSLSELLSLLIFWIILFSFLMIGIHALQIRAVDLLIARFFDYLPHIIAALLILIGGWVLANFLAYAALISAVNRAINNAPVVARVVRWGIILLTSSMALIQLGIGQEVVVAILSILLGGIVLAAAIAFGLGGRDLAKDFLERKIRKGIANDKEEGRGLSHL